MKIAQSDLVEISIGGNDARAYHQGGGTLAGVPAATTASAARALAGVNALVGVGARTTQPEFPGRLGLQPEL